MAAEDGLAAPPSPLEFPPGDAPPGAVLDPQSPLAGHKRSLEENGDSLTNSGGKKWPGWPGESVFRLIIPIHKVGSIIGRKGEFIKKMCEETRSRIKIVEGFPGADERVVLVSAKEEPESEVPPAIDGLLRVHRQVVEGPEVDIKAPPPPEVLVGTITARLLVPASQAGSLIGRQGTTIRTIQEESGANIRVLPEDDLPIFALEEDRVVEVSGPVRSVYKSLELILSHLRKFLVDRSVVQLFERPAGPRAQLQGPPRGISPEFSPPMGNWGAPMAQNQQQRSYAPPAPPLQQDYSSYGGNQGASTQTYSSSGTVLADLAGQRNAVSLYGRDPASGRPSAVQAPPVQAPVVSIKEVTACMQIPISYADAIIGVGGSNIVYLRRTSGATVSVQETRSATGELEMSVEIRGTTQQVQTAEQLLQSGYQAGAAAAGGAVQSASGAYSTDPYGSYGTNYGTSGTQYASGTPAQPTSPAFDQSEAYYQRTSHHSTNPETTYASGAYGY